MTTNLLRHRLVTEMLRTAVQSGLLCLCLLLSACATGPLKPVDLMPEDMCSLCRMAISEKQYAAEFLTADGDAIKFDDIGCMLNYLKARPTTKVAAYFFMDYETKRWLSAADASFVKSAEIASPMRGGIIAFQDKAAAETAVTRYQGQKLTFTELLR